MKNQQLKYEEAIKKIDEIVESLETKALDIDSLTDKVKEATYLIEFCRNKLKETDDSLNKILDHIKQ